MTATLHEWTLDLGSSRPLSMNDRLNRFMHAQRVKDVRELVHWKILAAHIPQGLDKVEVELHYAPPDARRRDEDNLVAFLKPACDAVCEAGIVMDDTPRYMTKHMPVLEPPEHPARLWLVIRELP